MKGFLYLGGGGYGVGPRAKAQSRVDSEIDGPRPLRPIRIHRKTSKSRLSGLSLIMCERPRSDHSRRAQCLAVIGLGSGSVTFRRPQFRQAKTVIASPASRSTARSGNIAPRHLSQVYIHYSITLHCRTNHPPEVLESEVKGPLNLMWPGPFGTG